MISVGETAETLEDVAEGRSPAGEFSVLAKSTFTDVHTMIGSQLSPGSMRDEWRFAFRMSSATADHKMIYLTEEFPGIQYLALHALRRREKRIIMLIHNVASARRRIPLATLRLCQFLDHVLCLSRASADELNTRYGIPKSRITVIGSRVDTDFFAPIPRVATRPQICSAGAVNRDYKTLVEAVRPLEVTTKIAADTQWGYSAGVSHVVDLPRFVEMRSWGDYRNLRSLYAESSAVVVPLERSMMSGVTVALEGMAMGRPVILTENKYVTDFLRDGETGYLVPAGDPDALRTKIKFVIDHPDQAEEVGRRAREWVLENFTVKRYVDRILGVLTR